MSPFLRALIVGSLATALPLQGVYAPIPGQTDKENEMGFAFNLKAGLAHDSNLFGAASSEIGSTVWTLAPHAEYKYGNKRTFATASYGVTLDQFEQRPGKKLLDSHDAAVRLAHDFSPVSIDLSDSFMATRNPESLLAGIKLNTDQSFTRNQLDAKSTYAIDGEKASVTAKARTISYSYRDATLGRSLDRIENLYGLSADREVYTKVKGVAEFRHQDVYYSKLGEVKNKTSEFLMGGLDYEVAELLTLTSRVGAEWRRRESERSTTAPYAEFSGKWDYDKPKNSFFAGGFAYILEETSDTARFNDTQVYRIFGNAQHNIGSITWVSASLTYEPSTLQGRRGQKNVDEKTLRGGVALAHQPTKNWTVSATFDYDRVNSDDLARNLHRKRVGVSATYSF